MKMNEIKKMDASAINAKISEVRKQLFDLRLEKATTGLEKPHIAKALKKEIARMLTQLNSKEASN